jgi:Bacterial Ig-like domain (group 3)
MPSQRTTHRISLRRGVVVASALAIGLPLGMAPLVLAVPASAAEASQQLSWSTAVNVGVQAPGSPDNLNFNSFNQPSVNSSGVVAFRARTKGEQKPVRGVYTVDSQTSGSSIETVAAVGDTVPQPNNSDGTFNEFPAFPRIDATTSAVATRGQSTPVLTYTLPDLTETKVGTSGVYATVGGSLVSGATLLGGIPEYSYYAVPDAPAGTRFDQFPGAPAIDGSTIVFKGNYTVDTTGQTGVYFRDLSTPDQMVEPIAGATTRIPNQPAEGTALFGSTAPPSAAGGKTVFTAWDNEAAPTLGGIYLADTTPSPELKTVIGIGDEVPGQTTSDRITNVGEGLSFDGRYVAFWASWGSETRTIVLSCPADGNQDIIDFCLEQYPDGYTTTVPVHQGFFVADTTTNQIHPVTTTGSRFSGFQYWVFSGRPPGTGGGDEVTLEPARWRSSAFVAVSSSGMADGEYQVAFKGTPVAGGSGIYLGQGPSVQERIVTVVDTTSMGTTLDGQAPADTSVTSIGLERDGFRGRLLAINASMLNADASASWAGIYVAQVPAELAVQSQTVSITSTPPAEAFAGGTYAVAAMADSGLPVTFSIDGTTTNEACTLDGSTVRFEHAGTCVINADQPGDAAYSAAPQVQQSITVTVATTAVNVVTTPASTVFGQQATATATVTAVIGTPTGAVQFAVDGADLGAPVEVVAGTATSGLLLDASAQPLAPSSHEITALFSPTDPTVFGSSTGSVSHVVAKAATSISLAVTSTKLTATVAPVSPGAGEVTGVVEFSVGGVKVGEATLLAGVATLDYVVPSGLAQTVAAVFAGDATHTGSSVSKSRNDPKITATVASKYRVTKYGWYRAPVTITFTCVATTAPLTGPCPARVVLSRNGGGQSVTRTIMATDGGVATAVVKSINIDLVRPAVRVGGVRNGATYMGKAPTPRCLATDALSGVATCKVTTRKVGARTYFRVLATDRAGNQATSWGSFRTLTTYVQDAKFVKGAFQMKVGKRYVIIVSSTTRPRYYYAAVAPRTPTVSGPAFNPAGYHRWAMGVRASTAMKSHDYWNLGVRIGTSMKSIRIQVL